MKILGTPFELITFFDAWTIARQRTSSKWICDSAIAEAQHANAVSLVCPDGVMTMSLIPDEGGRMRALVLMAVSTRFAAGAFQRNEPHVIRIARDMGASVLAFRTQRRGWSRLLGQEWSRDGDLYFRSI